MIRSRRSRRRGRRGVTTMEAVIATGITLPVAAALLFLGIRVCRKLYFVIGNGAGWPY